jgi:c-di-GMP-binding flagellar brake protein YcgR
MLQNILSIGDKLEIRQMDQSGRLMINVKTYVSQLVDIIDQDVINIAAPIGNNRVIILLAGENYNLWFYSNKGLYQCKCEVINNFKEGSMVISQVRVISELQKFQRRQYYRLECIYDIEYRVITKEMEIIERKVSTDDFSSPEERTEFRKRLNQLNNEWVKATFNDLSGGGARFTSRLSHEQGDKLRIKFDFNLGKDMKKLVIGAEVVASTKVLNRSDIYEHRVEFKEIGKNDREDLIKFIFEQERRRRKNDKN